MERSCSHRLGSHPPRLFRSVQQPQSSHPDLPGLHRHARCRRDHLLPPRSPRRLTNCRSSQRLRPTRNCRRNHPNRPLRSRRPPQRRSCPQHLLRPRSFLPRPRFRSCHRCPKCRPLRQQCLRSRRCPDGLRSNTPAATHLRMRHPPTPCLAPFVEFFLAWSCSSSCARNWFIGREQAAQVQSFDATTFAPQMSSQWPDLRSSRNVPARARARGLRSATELRPLAHAQ